MNTADNYIPLPDPAKIVEENVNIGGGWVRHERVAYYTAHQLRSYVEADRAMRAAQPAGAQAAPAAVAGLIQFGGCPACGSRSCTARQCSRTLSPVAQTIHIPQPSPASQEE